MPIKAVISDFGGVLVRTVDRTTHIPWEQRLGIPPGQLPIVVFDSETSRRAGVGLIPASGVWEAFGAQFNLTADEVRTFRRDFFAGDQVNTALVDFLQSLRPRYKTAILSNAWSDLRKDGIEGLGLDGAVDTVVISAEERVAKPDRRIYEIAVGRLGVALDEAVFIDDLEANIAAARNYGMRGVLFRDTARAIAEVREHLARG